MITVKIAETKEELNAIFKIREEVFIKGQGISKEIEKDAFDKDAIHFILYNENKPAACGRLRFVGGKAKLERVAVLVEFRGKHLGQVVTKEMIKAAKEKGYNEIYMNAQYYLLDYYKKLGFKEVGKPFDDAGIKHIKMIYEKI
ncbi:MAG: GNAT family N-acetyltransferase [Candidatus ainarchaeum sp.]|nr:GNAT family N-acetyltransferase [Candidatus ainarchaeum sp.]